MDRHGLTSRVPTSSGAVANGASTEMDDSTVGQRDDPPPRERWHWKGPTVVIGLITLVVAVLALGRDVFGFEIKSDSTTSPTSAVTTRTTRTNTTAATVVVPGPTPESEGLQLTTLKPMAGGSWFNVRSRSIFDLACATNSDRDRERAVQFEVPRGYTGFRSNVAPAGTKDIAQLDIRDDGVISTSARLDPGQSGVDVSTTVVSQSILELRITCARPGGLVTFSNAVLTR
jgi:hypothetical protein